jgi:mono/diheme cytochrome c family protein
MLRTLMMRGIGIAAAAACVAGLSAATARAAGQDAALVEKGKALYAAQKCSMCHSIAGVGKKTLPLDGVGARLSAEDIRLWFTDPVAAAKKANSTKKPVMPVKFAKLPAADIDALVAYMQSLK